MNLETWINKVFPSWGLQRSKARAQARLYDAAQSTQYTKAVRGRGLSPDSVMNDANSKLRDRARDLDENHDLAIGVINALTDNVVGSGLIVEPMAMSRTGKLNERVNDELRKLWSDFWRLPEVTGELPGAEVERMLCRSWLRDGEVLTRHIDGSGITHLHQVPYSIELLEADFLPFDNMGDTGITHGVEKDAWGRPIAYHLYVEHPGDMLGYISSLDTRRVPAQFITHLKTVRRIGQTRGVPIIHGAIQRLSDIFEYEESERIAARVASDFTGYIKRSADMAFDPDSSTGNRTMQMQAGMIWDNLLPGEEIGTLGTDRPNTALQDFRNSQLRAVASGTGTNYSTVSRDYNGTYSAQRQEMVESRPAYQRLTNYFVAKQMLPIWERFIVAAESTGLIRIPMTVDRISLLNPQIRGPGTPWIDPLKEVQADTQAIESGIKSRPQVIRERGGDPAQVDQEREKDTAAPVNEEPNQSRPSDSNETDETEETEAVA